MLRFFDSTAFVKAFSRYERGHEQAFSLLAQPSTGRIGFATARIAILETLARIWRATNDSGELAKLERHFAKFAIYDLDLDHDLARSLILDFKLKGADAAILAAAIGLSKRERIMVEFISADHDQLRAAQTLARHERLRVIALPAGLK